MKTTPVSLTTLGLGCVLLGLVTFIIMQRQDMAPSSDTGRKLLDTVGDQLGAVRHIDVETARSNVSLTYGDAWSIDNRHGMPADPKVLQRLMDHLNAMTILEPRTALPDWHHRLGLALPIRPSESTQRLTFRGADERVILDLVVGDIRYDHAGRGTASTYVRHADEDQTWLVNGPLSIPDDPSRWLDCRLFAAGSDDLADLTIRRAGPSGKKPSLASSGQVQTVATIQDMLSALSCLDTQPETMIRPLRVSDKLIIADQLGSHVELDLYLDRARAFMKVTEQQGPLPWWRLADWPLSLFEIPADQADLLMSLAN